MKFLESLVDSKDPAPIGQLITNHTGPNSQHCSAQKNIFQMHAKLLVATDPMCFSVLCLFYAVRQGLFVILMFRWMFLTPTESARNYPFHALSQCGKKFCVHRYLLTNFFLFNGMILASQAIIKRLESWASLPDLWHFGADPKPRILPLTNGSGSGSGSCSFRHLPSRCQQKIFFLVFLLLNIWRYFT